MKRKKSATRVAHPNAKPLHMPRELTPRMRKVAEQIHPSITEDERPYFDRLWDIWLAEVQREQNSWTGAA